MQPVPADWEKARGIWMIEYNNFLLLARSPVEEVAEAIAEDADIWRPTRSDAGSSSGAMPCSSSAFGGTGGRSPYLGSMAGHPSGTRATPGRSGSWAACLAVSGPRGPT